MQFLWDYNNVSLGKPVSGLENALITSSDDGDIRVTYMQGNVAIFIANFPINHDLDARRRSNFFERPFKTRDAVLRTCPLPTSKRYSFTFDSRLILIEAVGTVSAYGNGSLVYHDMTTGLVASKTNSLVSGK